MDKYEQIFAIQNQIIDDLNRIQWQICHDHRLDVLAGMIGKAETDVHRLTTDIQALREAVNELLAADTMTTEKPAEMSMKNLGLLLQRSDDNCPDFYTNSLPIT